MLEFLGQKLVGLIAAPLAVVLAGLLGWSLVSAHYDHKSLTDQLATSQDALARSNRAVGQLQGAVTIQTSAVEQFEALAAKAIALSKTLQDAAARAHAGDDAQIAALVAKAATEADATACTAADARIRDYYGVRRMPGPGET
jgi:hypothetical protein